MNEFKEEELIAFAQEFTIPFYTQLAHFPLIKAQTQLLPYPLVKQKGFIPIKEDGDTVEVVFMQPNFHLHAIELKLILGKKIIPSLASKEVVLQAIERCYQAAQKDQTILQSKTKSKDEVSEEVYDLSEEDSQSQVVNFLNQTFIQALKKEASDIHFDPSEEGLNIRMRLDGVLVPYYPIPKEFSKQLTTRIKVLSRLDISEVRLPQDGRIKIRYLAKEIDFRVSTIPTVYGERVVLRILDNTQVVLGLQESGMDLSILHSFRAMMKLTQGLILVTGPTGSGKTSTLYSAISELDATSLNIMTVEDPVEFKLKDLAQIGVNPKIDFTFAKGLRHILRQDPDVIMIGEIRDKETAEIAIQAALTGHLVVSTLHTNDAPSAMTRLVDMGIEPYLITSCVTGVLAQRLVRKLCPYCKEEDDQEDKKKILGIPHYLPVYKAKGCDLCFGLGFKGRVGIFEWMEVKPSIKEQFMKSQDSYKMTEIAAREGMMTLRESGIKRVIEGKSSLDEVLKIVL